MSPSDAGARGQGMLVAKGGPGVEIQVIDTRYQTVARGTEELNVTLPEGIYFVDWTAGGETTQRLVRVLPLPEPMVVSLDVPSDLPDDAAVSEAAQRRDQIAELVTSELRPSERNYGSRIAVLIRTDDERIRAEIGAELRILNSHEAAMRSNDHDLAELPPQSGFALRSYRVKPGQYHLRFTAASGDTLDQTVPAIEGRRTMIVLRPGMEDVLIAEGDAFRAEARHGVDPAQTVIFTVPAGSSAEAVSEGGRLAGILLHDLAARTGSLGPAFVRALDESGADPLLRLYGALTILSCLEHGRSPALDESWPEEPEAQEKLRRRWLDKAVQWLASLDAKGLPADFATAGWRLQSFGMPWSGASRITRPPMLECSWRWAVAHSVTDSRAVPMTASLRAAARSAGRTAPWLCWRGAAAKAQLMPVSKGHVEDVRELFHTLAGRVKELLASSPESPDQAAADWLSLAPEIRATALRTLEFSDDILRGVSADPAELLAETLAMPEAQLRRRLIRTIGEIAGLGLASGTEMAAAAGEGEGPPAFRRPLIHSNDPNKGRFGGRAERAGFGLLAEFREVSKDWVRISLVVEADRPIADGTAVQFYLHDSFRPARIVSQFKDGRAREKVTSWGGFTVGVWIPAEGVELELDLARLADAPKIVRTR